jgi:hypothetical protein
MATPRSRQDPRPKRLRNFASKTGWVAWSTIIAAMVGVIALQARSLLFDEPASRQEQLEDIRARMARDNRFPAVQRILDMRGSGASSLFMLVRDNRVAAQTGDLVDPRSDELRIYDFVDGEYVLSFQFQPENPRDGGLYFWFRFDGALDLNQDEARDIVGSFSRYFMGPEFPQPVVLTWNAKLGEYQLDGLIQSASYLKGVVPTGAFGKAADRYYREATVLMNGASAKEGETSSISGFAVQEYAFALARDGYYLLLTAIIVDAPTHADPYELRLIPMKVSFEGAQFETAPCYLYGQQRPDPLTTEGALLNSDLLLATWNEQELVC